MLRRTITLILAMSLTTPLLAQENTSGYTFHAQSELVLVNVTVRDKNGNFVRDLKPEDFTILEDNKPQHVASFDIENTDAVPAMNVPQVAVLQTVPQKSQPAPTPEQTASPLRDRRLIVLFFDLTSMQPDEIDRSATAAQKYVDEQMAPADLVAVLSLSGSLQFNQDFTTDRAALKKVLQSFNAGAGQGFEQGTTGTTEGTPDTGQPFTADDTEYNIFNTDRRLEALRSVADKLSRIEQKKSLIYFSSGMDRTGIENQSELRATVNAAVRANLAIYTMDIRGLQALVPGGDAQNASLRGTSPYSGQATVNALNSNFSTQETLVTLAGDTGGRAFLDSNDFSQVFKRVQQDTATYYILGYRSTNTARDGKYRRISVKIDRPGVKFDYRRGYYAPADFKHSAQEDRERQLDEELASELPATDLPVYLSAGYFRLADNRFYVPISLMVPGSEIPFTRSSDKDKATLDILGMVTDETKRPLDQIRDTVKVAVSTSTEVRRKNVQYDSGFTLPAGKYHLKFVLRENQTGRIGSFETDLSIPDFKNAPLKMSTVLVSNQVAPAGKRKTQNPLVRDGSELIPSVTHVFSSGQHLYLYYEVYEPASKNNSQKDSGTKILTSVAFFSGKTKAYETPLVQADKLNAPDRHAAVFQLDVPLTQLKPGFYTCQVNVIDDTRGNFLFPRLALLVRP